MRVTARKMIEYYERQIVSLQKKELDKPLLYNSEKGEAFQSKLRRHQHNGLQGSCAMAENFVDRVMTLDSTTHASKVLASEISVKLRELRQLLKERVD